jgi:hypothetical protein
MGNFKVMLLVAVWLASAKPILEADDIFLKVFVVANVIFYAIIIFIVM